MNSLSSADSFEPFDFYSLSFCSPDEIEESAENLGEILTGNSIKNSVYSIKMNVAEVCKLACTKTLTKEEAVLL